MLRDSEFWNELGLTTGSCGAHSQAETAFRQAFKINPKNYEAKLNFSVTLNVLDRSEEALRMIEEVPDRVERKAVIKANILMDLGRFDEAIPCYEKAIAEEPEFSLPYARLLGCLRQTKNPLYEYWLERAIKNVPKEPWIAIEYARHLFMAGKLDEIADADWFDKLEAKTGAIDIIGRGVEDQFLIACARLWRQCGLVVRDGEESHLDEALRLLDLLGPSEGVCEQARILTITSAELGLAASSKKSLLLDL